MEIKIKEVDGIEIRIDEGTGKFSATIDGKKTTRVRLSDIEKIIKAGRATLEVYNVDRSYSNLSIRKLEIIGFSSDGQGLSKSGNKVGYGSFYILTNKQKSEFESLIKQQERINNDWEKLIQHLKRVHYKNFSEYMDK